MSTYTKLRLNVMAERKLVSKVGINFCSMGIPKVGPNFWDSVERKLDLKVGKSCGDRFWDFWDQLLVTENFCSIDEKAFAL